jgi:hypothetical protein
MSYAAMVAREFSGAARTSDFTDLSGRRVHYDKLITVAAEVIIRAALKYLAC